ncbi:MAG: SIMPL domain-containing protein [bacterium]|nr:SIMPL domain-containing protein [bacterium]
MNKILIAITLLSLFAGCASLSTQAVSNDTKREDGYITVNSVSKTEISPDTTDISFTVLTTDTKSMQKASEHNKEISDKVYGTLKTMINPQNGDYIKTADFNATPIYTYSGSKKIFNTYQVTNRVLVHTKSVDLTGKIVDSAINAGFTNVNSINFSISDYESHCNDLLVKATKEAYKRGKLLANAMDTSLSGVRTLQSSCSTNNGYSYNIARYAKAMDTNADGAVAESASSGVPVSGGMINLSANVNATFYVK